MQPLEPSKPMTRLVTRRRPGRDRPRREGDVADRRFRLLTAAFASTSVVLLGAMALQLARASKPAWRRFGLGFIGGQHWDPSRELYGALPFIVGTVASSLLALLLAIPVALGVAILLAELAPGRLARPLGQLVELLAAIPSVVYGLWGLFVLVPWLRVTVQPALVETLGALPLFRGTPRGFGVLAAGLVLAIMSLPSVAVVGRDVLRAVPASHREGALALGATRWEAVRLAVLPQARAGLVGAALLGLGRALGETMAVAMVIGNRPELSGSLLSPASTLASVVANEFAEATDSLHLAALSALGLVLFGVTLLLNLAARLLVWQVGRLPDGARRA